MSSQVISLDQARRDKEAMAAFGRWQRRIGHTPAHDERLCDLPPAALAELAELGHQATLALYDVVLGVRGLGPGEVYPDLEPRAKLEALDAFLFLVDQVRFELMARLGWLEPPGPRESSIMEMARDYRQIAAGPGQKPLKLTEVYPSYEQVRRRLHREPEAVVRSVIPQALTAFKDQLA
ncbi:MAG: hypothetical protein K9K66_06765 [Desulfarculaceae bacterium]|nr:hypothetical protein [Desulfarculaceae bacterium]MCF8071791.1 hypothetical protein [Desulfarculaceae bacterium]MCF8101341.1 hypothetical protein [Desulfarculaceae bacterium]MCF8117198.1 hypothetical protein [Desulfarculaceae bacterium]